MTCPSCGLTLLPAEARFCARCGVRLQSGGPAAAPARAAAAPVWLLVLLWVGAVLLLWVAAGYAALAAGVISPAQLGAGPGTEGVAALIAVCAASLGLGHVAAAVGLMGARPWSRPFATMVCVVWALTCVGLPVGVLGISALWRASVHSAGASLPR